MQQYLWISSSEDGGNRSTEVCDQKLPSNYSSCLY